MTGSRISLRSLGTEAAKMAGGCRYGKRPQDAGVDSGRVATG
jgi:hypothetical protein